MTPGEKEAQRKRMNKKTRKGPNFPPMNPGGKKKGKTKKRGGY